MRRPLPPSKWLGRIGLSSKSLIVVISVVQLVILVGLVIWNFQDPRLEQLGFTQVFRHSGELQPNEILSLRLMYSLACGLLAFQFTSFVWASASVRSLTFAALALTLLAADLAAITNWQRISWSGRKSRIQPAIASLQRISERLLTDWPRKDGEDAIFGPYMAYPTYDPSILVLLMPHQVAEQTYISTIDRSGTSILRFQLSDGQHSIWIELHKDGSIPEKFTSGLGAKNIVDHKIEVAGGWYLVRYHDINEVLPASLDYGLHEAR